MEEYIRKAFKSLEDFKVEIEPTINKLNEAIEEEETIDGLDIKGLFERESSYIITYDFEHAGHNYSLFLEALNDGESCDITFEEFDVNNINEVLVEVLDSEHEFIGSLTGEDITLDTKLTDAISKAGSLISGEELPVNNAEGNEEEEKDSNDRVFINGDPEMKPEEEPAPEEHPDDVLPPEEPVDLVTEVEPEDEEPKTEQLNESEAFNLNDAHEVDKADKVLKQDKDNAIEQIVDASAESKEDLKKSYVGSIILQCPTCKSMMYKDPDKLVKVEGEEELYNIDEECPHCGAKDGFEIVGQVASLDVDPEAEPVPPMEEEPAPVIEPEPEVKEEEKVEVEETHEDLDKPEDGDEDKQDEEEGKPSEEEEKKEDSEVEDKEEKPEEDAKKKEKPLNEEIPEDEDKEEDKKDDKNCEECKECLENMSDIILESFDEDKFDRLVTRYLKETYSNVKSYKTTEAGLNDGANKIVMEGMITFKSEKQKPTTFVFEAKEITAKNQVKFVGINEMFSPSKAFTLLGTVDNNKLLSESLAYRYESCGKKVRGRAESFRKR